jgi:hypothetical protein
MKMKLALLAVVAIAMTAMPAVPAQAHPVTSGGSSASVSDNKGTDSDPHLKISLAETKGETAKFARATAAAAPRGVVPMTCLPYPECAPPPVSHSLGGRQQPQQNGYWCGPAAVSEALSHRGISLSQASTASQLKTNTSGTAWSGVYVSTSPSTGYPVADVLNNRTPVGVHYYTVPVGTVTSTIISDLQRRVAYDVWVGDALVNDAWETPTSAYHLVGHPKTSTIFHWFTTYAYSSSGAVISYEDSASGGAGVSFAASVPKYSSLSSTAIAHIVGGRGYVW